MKRHCILVLAASLIALPGVALAGACTAESVAALKGTTCTIGDLTFDFKSYLPGGGGSGNKSEYSASNVFFTPDATADSFKLSGPFSSSSTGYSEGDGTLFYTVSVSDGTLTGVAATVNNSSLSVSPNAAKGSVENLSEAYTEAFSNLNGDYAYNEQLLEQSRNSRGPGGVTSVNYGEASPFTPETSDSGYAYIESSAYNYSSSAGSGGTASASFTSADFTFEVTQAPEPSVWLSLLVMGLLAIIPIRRLKRG